MNETNFPDANFRKYITEQLNTDNPNKSPLPYDATTNSINTDIEVIIDCSNRKINSLKGVEFFKSIHDLKCANNHLLSISVNSSINYIYNTVFGVLDDLWGNLQQTRFIVTETGTVKLKELDPDFNPDRVRNLTGATWVNQSEGTIQFTSGVTAATYEYNCLSVEPNDQNKDKYYMHVQLVHRIPVTDEYFPDENFRTCLINTLNNENKTTTPYDATTNTINPLTVGTINCNEQGIKSLNGIELFPKLGALYCQKNNLIALKLHPNVPLWAAAFKNQTREVGGDASIDLTKLDSNFDPSKVLEIEGATLADDGTLTFERGSFIATYKYIPVQKFYDEKGDDGIMEVTLKRYADKITVKDNTTDFPDEEFRKYLQSLTDYYDATTGKISIGIGKMDIDWTHDGITNLKGIEKFIHLTTLNINDRKVGKSLAEVDLPTSLVFLYCSNVAGLTAIKNLSELTNLEILNIANNASLKTLDVTNNTKLKKLSCGADGNAGHETILESLTLPSPPSSIEELDCSRTKLTSLNLHDCTGLKFLKINFARNLGELVLPSDPTNNGKNLVQTITCDNCNLSTLDLSNCVLLRRLECSNNVLTGLDLSTCTVLDTLSCGNPLAYSDSKFNKFGRAKLDLSHNLTLKWLECMNLDISELNLSNHSQLEYINCGLNRERATQGVDERKTAKLMLTLPASAPNLRTINCGSNNLTDELNVITNYPNLEILECADNNIGDNGLDISQNANLWYLYARVNDLKELNVRNNTKLRHLTCSYNNIPTLDVTQNTLLRSLNCNNNTLTVLDLSNNTELDTLHVENNQLIALDLTNQTKMFDIRLNNQRRALGIGRHFNMDRRNNSYEGSNLQDLKGVILSSQFNDYNIITAEDDQNFDSGSGDDTPETTAETGTGDETAIDNSALGNWLTFDWQVTEATYNYQTGGKYNADKATDPDKPEQGGEQTAAKTSSPMRSQSVPATYGDNYALMDVTVTREYITTGVAPIEATTATATRIRAERGAALIDGADERIDVYTTAGILVASTTATAGTTTRIPLATGLYIVVTPGSTTKLLIP